ncbi:hypothetical protein ACWFMI_00305 [Nocardiopsis terrae]
MRKWSEEVLRQAGNPRVAALTTTATENVNSFVFDMGPRPGSALELEFDSTYPGCGEPGVLVGLSLGHGGIGFMVRLPDSLPDSEAVLMLADQLQEEVLESTHGDPAPLCPGHVHPAKPEMAGGVPSWVCPRDGKLIRSILPPGLTG